MKKSNLIPPRRSSLKTILIALGIALTSGSAPFVTAKYDPASSAESLRTTSWQDEIASAKDEVHALSDSQIATAKQALVDAHAALGRSLETGTEAHAEGWKEYLLWYEVKSELESDSPNASVLNDAEQKVRRNFKGLELGVFTRYRDALNHYRSLYQLSRRDDLEAYFRNAIDLLDRSTQALEEDPSDWAAAHTIGRIVGVLEAADQAPNLVSRVRLQFSHPNLYGWVSERFVNSRFSQPVNDTSPVSQTILGTYQQGTAYTTGRVSFAFVPNSSRAQITARLDGQTYSQTVGTRPFGLRKKKTITIHSTGQTSVNANKTLFVDSKQISSLPAQACCDTDTTIQCINGPQLLMGIISSEVHKKKPQAEQIASRRAEQQISESFDSRISQAMAGGRMDLLEEIRATMIRMDSTPQSVAVRTTTDHLMVDVVQRNDLQVGAMEAPPQFPKNGDFGLVVHESALNNMLEAVLGGKTLSRDKLIKMIEKRSPESQSEVMAKMGDEDWSIQFPSTRPITFQFSDGNVKLTIRGDRFTRDQQTINDDMLIEVTYQVSATGSGIRLVRVGELKVDYVSTTPKNARQIAFRSFATDKFGLLFPQEAEAAGFQLTDQFADAPRANLSDVQISHGWAHLGWMMNGSPTEGVVTLAP